MIVWLRETMSVKGFANGKYYAQRFGVLGG